MHDSAFDHMNKVLRAFGVGPVDWVEPIEHLEARYQDSKVEAQIKHAKAAREREAVGECLAAIAFAFVFFLLVLALAIGAALAGG